SNGVDLERFHAARRGVLGPALRRALGLADGERVCAAIGSGFTRKGFDLLLRLWREAPPRDTALVLVGDDERLGHYRGLAEALGGRVRVTGPRPDVEAVLAAADVACLPSRQEAFGNVVLEACAAGVPVVTTRRAGAAELLEGPLAALVVDDPEDLDALARALAHALGPAHDALAPGVDLEHVIAADGDPDHLLTRPDCRLVKLQRKVVVGRVESAGAALWVKRYAVFAWRVALASLGRTSPAFRAWAGARVLAAHGFATPEPVAAIEFRRAGLLRRSFFITREVAGAVTADVRWQAILADPDARRRRAARRAWAAAVARRARRKDRGRRRTPAPGAGPTVTCTIVCQDEEAHMVPCLESVAWCDEIVVVDGGSRDRTAALARRLTDRVLTNPWPGYRAQKQFSLDAARGEWVLNLDADERISPELADEIRA